MGESSEEHLPEVGQQPPAEVWKATHDQSRRRHERWRCSYHLVGVPHGQRDRSKVSMLEVSV